MAKSQLDLIRGDLAAFADPGSLVRLEDDVPMRVSWEQGGRAMSLDILERVSPDQDFNVMTGRGEMRYSQFLASAPMADLLGLARNTARVVKTAESYITPQAVTIHGGIDEEGDRSPEPAVDLMLRLAAISEQATNVVFVSAEAGVGKSALLKESVRRRAEAYLRGESSTLWLYVDAQGRRLARLDEAVAAELDGLRAAFPYHAVTSLIRTGSLVLAIDGFDELIGSVGSYEEAFGSLASLIQNVNGSGCIVAAARSTYYEHEFLSRLGRVTGFSSDGWNLRGVRLLEWTAEERATFVSTQLDSAGLSMPERSDVERRLFEVFEQGEVRELGFKPLFVSRTLEILMGGGLPEGADLLDRLVAAYVTREAREKYISVVRGQPLIGEDQYRTMLSEIAEEMWRQETRELSRTSVRDTAALVGEVLEIGEQELSEVVERLPSSALLKVGSSPGAVAFEHDVFFSYFLVAPVVKAWMHQRPRQLTTVLRRGRLPEEASRLASAVAKRNASPQYLVQALEAGIDGAERGREQIRQNSGSLAAYLMLGEREGRLLLSGFYFGDVSLGEELVLGVDFIDCQFVGSSLRAASFEDCTARGTSFEAVVIDPASSRLDIRGLQLADCRSLRVARPSGGIESVYAPSEIAEVMRNCQLPAALEKAPALRFQVSDVLVNAVNFVCGLYASTNLIAESDDRGLVMLSADVRRTVMDGLLEHGLITAEARSASGRKIFYKRHFRPEDLLAHLQVGTTGDLTADRPFDAFWGYLEMQS